MDQTKGELKHEKTRVPVSKKNESMGTPETQHRNHDLHLQIITTKNLQTAL